MSFVVPPRISHAPAFSLIELLVVITIVTILFGLGVPAFQRIMQQQTPARAAAEFVSALRSARQFAIDNTVRTRLVLADSNLIQAQAGAWDTNASYYGVYSFYVPQQPGGGSAFLPLSGTASTILASGEVVSMPWLSIPSGFVGQWIPCAIVPEWRKISSQVVVSATFLTNASWTTPQFNFYNPPKYWDPAGSNAYYSNYMAATFPLNYHQTPYPTSYPRLTTNVAPDEPAYSIGTPVKYKDMWPVQSYSYFTDITNQVGSYAALGTVENASTTRRRFFDLRGIEFGAEGLPLFRWTNSLTFRFSHKQNTNNFYEVVIDRITGVPRVR